MASVPKEDTVGHVMSSPVVTVKTSATLAKAAETMVKKEIGSIIIMGEKNAAGIVTERDIMKYVIKNTNVLRKPVKQFMTKPLVTVGPNTPVQEAFELMLKHRIRRLPVLDGSKLVGIVTEKDLMRWVLRVSYEPNIPAHIKAILELR
jgi:CBS domain-containing protein